MHPSGIDYALWITGVVGETLLLVILLKAKVYRSLPIFVIWVAFILLLEPTFYWLSHYLSAHYYYIAFFTLSFPQYLLELGVLIEIAREVFSPVKRALSKGTLLLFLAGVVMIGLIAFIWAAHLNENNLAHSKTYVVMSTTMAILRIVMFLLIAGFSQLLGLSWKNHVLQLATGLAFYSVVSLIVELAHSSLHAGPEYAQQFYALDHLRIGGYLCALYFWCYVFAKKEAPRKEFSPQMTKILVSISGSAKRQRAVLARTRDQ